MATLRQHTATLLVPTIFFGYAIYANSALLLSSAAPEANATERQDLSLSYVIDGNATRDLDALYKKGLPHRDPSVGVFGNARYTLLGAGRKGVVVGDEGWFFTTEEFKTVSPDEIAAAVDHIDGIRKQLEAQGIRLVLAPLPAKSDIYAEELPSIMQTPAMSDAYGAFTGALREKGMTVADTRSALLKAKPFGEVFLKSDTHWTPNGAKATAEAIQTAIEGADIGLPDETVTAEWRAPVSIWGDLTQYVTSPDYAPRVGLQQENIPIYRTSVSVDAAGGDIFGDDTSVPVMLVGTSYSANENWSFADFLRTSLSTDVVNVAKEGLGPGVPMMDLLSGAALEETKPNVIVWEFPVRYLGTKTLWERAKQEPVGGHHA
jgi:alginate O-acetyltransferase complex protein AlgJ